MRDCTGEKRGPKELVGVVFFLVQCLGFFWRGREAERLSVVCFEGSPLPSSGMVHYDKQEIK